MLAIVRTGVGTPMCKPSVEAATCSLRKMCAGVRSQWRGCGFRLGVGIASFFLAAAQAVGAQPIPVLTWHDDVFTLDVPYVEYARDGSAQAFSVRFRGVDLASLVVAELSNAPLQSLPAALTDAPRLVEAAYGAVLNLPYVDVPAEGQTYTAQVSSADLTRFAVEQSSVRVTTKRSAASAVRLSEQVIVFNSNHNGNHEIYAMRVDGSGLTQLTRDARFDASWARVSPDRTRILFYRRPAGTGGGSNYIDASLWAMNADGSSPVELRAAHEDEWALQGHAEWSPDGNRLVMFGGTDRTSPQIYVTDAAGKNPRAITRRQGQNLDPSWSPDGRYIAFVGCPSAICTDDDYEVYVTRAEQDSSPIRLTNDRFRDHDPYFSPNGKSLAWLTRSSKTGPAGAWGIRIMRSIDSGATEWLINDGNINSYPAWSLDGKRVFFHRLVYGVQNLGFHVYGIDLDSMALFSLTSALQGSQEYPGN